MRNTGFHLSEISKIVKFIESKSEMVAARGCEEGNGELLSKGLRLPLCNMEQVLEILYTTLYI